MYFRRKIVISCHPYIHTYTAVGIMSKITIINIKIQKHSGEIKDPPRSNNGEDNNDLLNPIAIINNYQYLPAILTIILPNNSYQQLPTILKDNYQKFLKKIINNSFHNDQQFLPTITYNSYQ